MTNNDYVKKILFLPDDEDFLMTMSEGVNVTSDKEVKNIITCLKKTMEANNLVCLSAPSIGFNKRIFCMKFDTEIKTFINPVIFKQEDPCLSRESSNIIPGKSFLIPRASKIQICYQRPMGKPENKEFQGLAAYLAQQMVQELDGVFLSDFGLELDSDFDNASDKEQNEVIQTYLESLDLVAADIKKAAEEDEFSKQIMDATQYLTKGLTGEITIDNKG